MSENKYLLFFLGYEGKPFFWDGSMWTPCVFSAEVMNEQEAKLVQRQEQERRIENVILRKLS
jgi:hypothetical protein